MYLNIYTSCSYHCNKVSRLFSIKTTNIFNSLKVLWVGVLCTLEYSLEYSV